MLATPIDFSNVVPLTPEASARIGAAMRAAVRTAAPPALHPLAAAEDALRVAASAVADIRDFAVAGCCPAAENYADRAVEALIAAREQVAAEFRRLLAG